MRLSEERIQHVARQMAKQMRAQGAVETKLTEAALGGLIARVLIEDLQREEQIDAEARELLAKQRNVPPEDSSAYEAMFERVKREVAQRRGYPL